MKPDFIVIGSGAAGAPAAWLLSEKGYNRDYGARPLKRIIEKEIGDIIADALIKNQIKDDSYYTVGVKEGKFKLKIKS